MVRSTGDGFALAEDMAALAAAVSETRCLSRHVRPGGLLGGTMPLRMRVHDREPIGAALRRFKKLLERSGLTKELRKRKHYEKPCEIRRRAELSKQSAIRTAKEQTKQVG